MRCLFWSALSLLALQQHAGAQPVAASEQTAAAQAVEQAQQRTEAMQWLERMALAVEQLNYRGKFVYQQGNAVRLLHIEHYRDRRGVRERLYAYENRQLEILRNNNLVQANSPANRTGPILNYSQFTRLPASHLLRNSSYYRFEIGGEHEIAGYRTRKIAILPRDSLRYGFQYWLEIRTGMLLQQQLLNRDGEVLEKLLFTDIELGQPRDGQVLAGPVLPAQRRPTAPGLLTGAPSTQADRGLRRQRRSDADAALLQSSGQPPVDELSGLSSARAWSQDGRAEHAAAAVAAQVVSHRPSWQCVNPPRGYSLVAHQQSRQGNGALLDHLLYSDGLSQISVYIEQQRPAADAAASADKELPASRVGVMNVYRRQLDTVSITALGAAPYRTLRMLGGSMVRLSTAIDAQTEPAQ